jgi:hypothetical protein
MLLQTPIRLPSHPLRGADPVQLRRDSTESRPEFEHALGVARRSALGERAAVVQFGAVALGLARSQKPAPESAVTEDEAAEDEQRTRPDGATEPEAGDVAPFAAPSEPSSEEGGGGEPSEADHEQITEMKKRDREVRTHEQAHKAAGGAYTGSIRLSYQMGPDGKRYAVEGSVPIDVSPVAGDPAATLRKMEVVHRAANAPASPSSADRSVAAQAQRVTQQARAQLAAERYARASELLVRA